MNLKTKLLVLAILLLGIFFRLYHIEFGLPHSFYADEPEIAELAIKYTYEFRNIVNNGEYFKFIPISFVYGTFPAYMNTAVTMAYSKVSNLFGLGFDKTDIYIFMRTVNSLFSVSIVVAAAALTQKLFRSRHAALYALLFAALNWKLVVHAHYINADIIQTALLTLSYFTLMKYFKRFSDTKYTILTGLLFGLAVGTKITTLIALPLFLYIFFVRKDLKGLLAFVFTAAGIFIVSNPFSIVFAENFAFRIMTMFTKEAGMVFDSVDPNPFKYLVILTWISTPLLLLTALFGKYKSLKSGLEEDEINKEMHIFFLGNVLLYLVFFSLQSRYVERWLLPILPIVIIYASYGLLHIEQLLNSRKIFATLLLVLVSAYVYFPVLLLSQFQRYTPKASAYLYLRDRTDEFTKVLGYTEEGLDPLNKLRNSSIQTVKVYTDEAAHLFFPEDPSKYKYVVIASRPMQYYKKPTIKEAYPLYHERWAAFEKKLFDNTQFELLEEFTLPKPNLIPLSDVYIYENLNR